MNDHFILPFTHALISTSQDKSMNPRGALYALVNCPCWIFCPRGVVQLSFVHDLVCATVACVVTGELLVPQVFVGFSVVLIFPCVSKSAHDLIGAAGWMYILSTF